MRAGLAWDGAVGGGTTFVAGANAYSRGELTASPTTPPPPAILNGSFTGNWAAVVDYWQRSDIGQSIVMTSDGKLTQFVDAYEGLGTITIGTATATSLGNDGIIAWGRWMSGTTGDGKPPRTRASDSIITRGDRLPSGSPRITRCWACSVNTTPGSRTVQAE